MSDNVNSPSHYSWLPVEPIEILELLPYNKAAACKYIIRSGRKDIAPEVEDLEKALYHIKRELRLAIMRRDGKSFSDNV